MVNATITKKLHHAFPNGFINCNLEFIAHKEANEYILLEDCETAFDVKCKVLEWLSRGAHKTCPFNSAAKNDKFHLFMRNGINDFLGTDFTETDMEMIYDHIGNRCNHELTVRFVNSGYDMTVFTKKSIVSELLNCPFCGGVAEIYETPHVPRGTDYTPRCKNPSCCGRLSKKYSTRETAIAMFNRRAENE